MDKNSRFYKVAVRFRPKLAGMSGLELTGNLFDTAQLLYALPFALITAVLLFLYTDLDKVEEYWPTFLLLLVLNILFNRFGYQLQFEVLPGVFASASGALDILVVWSAALLFGPTAVWLIVLVEFGRLTHRWQQDKNGEIRWFNIRQFVDVAGHGSLSIMVGVWVYTQLGGAFPFSGFDSTSLLPAIAATAAAFLFPTFSSWPIYLFIANNSSILNGDSYSDSKAMIKFLLISTNLSGLVYPFAILAADLYITSGIGVYLFFIVGALLASILAHQLSLSVADSQQRSRELSALEQLGRAIMDTPPNAANLSDLLAEHTPKMLSLNMRTHIWLSPDEVLYQNPAKDAGFYIAQSTPYLQGDAPYYELENVVVAQTGMNGLKYVGLIVPIQNEAGDNIGGIYLHRRREIGTLHDFIPMLQSLAAQIASAIRRAEVYEQTLNNEKMAQELALAGRIQTSFLPRAVPDISGWDIAAMLQPARQTSGDFYDFMELENGRFGFLVADVADKGTGAALYMALSRTLIRTYALQYPDAPEEALRQANERILADTESDQFVTVFYGVLDPQTGTLTYANAGHNPAYLINSNGEMTGELIRTGIPLGMFGEMVWQQETVSILPGGTLAMYTDGVTEAQNSVYAEFGEERLLDVLKGGTAQGMVTAVLDDIDDFVGDAPQFDDVTLVIAARQMPPKER